MAKCAACGKSILLGGVKDHRSGSTYCSAQCRFKAFYPRFAGALAKATVTSPKPLSDLASASGQVEDDWGNTEFHGVADQGKDLLVVLLGLAGAATAALVIYWLVNLVRYPFHAQTFWFVIPVGAFLCGMVAGIGFWLGLRQLDRLPELLTYLAAALGGAASYVLIYFLMWWLAEIPGGMLRDKIGFVDFLQFVLEHQRIRVDRGQGQGFEVGKFGYARFAINLIGFTFGVITTVKLGGGKGYCSQCKRYLRSVAKQIRSESDPEAAAAGLHPVITALQAGRVQEAFELHARSGQPGGKEYWTTTIAIEACPQCGMRTATLTASVPGDRGSQPVQGFTFQGTTGGRVPLSNDGLSSSEACTTNEPR
jgi:hypothetical protein